MALPSIPTRGTEQPTWRQRVAETINRLIEQQNPYSIAWTAATANPAIGNGTILSGYVIRGSWVTATVRIVMGTTTTFGTGAYSFSLPIPCRAGYSWNGSALLNDSSAALFYLGTSHINAESAVASTFSIYPNAGTVLAPTSPFTWASSDQLLATISYPAV